MYTESRNNFSLRNVVLQFLFIALFIFILIWLFPTKKDVRKANNSSNGEKITINNGDLTVLYDRIFNENLMSMKEAAQSYYTTERLPQKVGESTKITLKEMLDKKIILPFKDKNGKQCDLNASYVQITKKENEFVMKVNLKCGEEENYLLTYMGCYDYCSQTICEKKGYVGKVYNVKTTTTPKKNICKVVNGKYYDNNGNVVSKSSYEKACTTAPKYYCRVVNGKYYDNKGNVVSKSNYEKACTTAQKYYCRIVNGKYYDNNGKVVSEKQYIEACTTKPEVEKNYYCEIVNGKYYDKSGKSVSESEYEESCFEKKYTYLYEYKRVLEGSFIYGNWSEWTTTLIKPSSTVEVEQKTQKVRKLTGYKVVTEDDLSKPITKKQEVVVATKQVTSCASYNLTSTVTGYTEQYIGRFKYSVAPKETTEYTYRKVGEYNWYCDPDCTAGTVLVYDVYQKVPQTSASYSCGKYKTDTSVITATKNVVTGYEKKETKTKVYDEYTRVLFRSRTKTRTPGSTDLKWSTYNDMSLLSIGYSYTGNVKIEVSKK